MFSSTVTRHAGTNAEALVYMYNIARVYMYVTYHQDLSPTLGLLLDHVSNEVLRKRLATI